MLDYFADLTLSTEFKSRKLSKTKVYIEILSKTLSSCLRANFEGHNVNLIAMAASVTPDEVNKLVRPTDGFLCPLSANSFGIDFLSFTISDYETKKTIFEVGRDNPTPQDVSVDFSSIGEDMYRKIKYDFSEDVLRLPYIQTSLTFAVGPRELREFRMIERHYFRDQLIKSFDFEFGFCIPGSVNTWDTVYSLPAMSEKLINEMIDSPFETKSDSFYFVNGVLIMHNKASYKYLKEDAAQSKKSYEEKFQSKGSKAAKVTSTASSAIGAKSNGVHLHADQKGVEGLSGDMKAVTMTADSKEVTARGAGSKAAHKEHAWSKEDDYF